MLRDNKIVVAGLPAHNFPILQQLDVSVFGPLKEELSFEFESAHDQNNKSDRNYIITVCEILRDSFYRYVTPQNAMTGFRCTRIWSEDKQGVYISMIHETDLKSGNYKATVRKTSHACDQIPQWLSLLEKTLAILEFLMPSIYVACFLKSEKLVSDGAVVENGTIRVVTTSGASLTSDMYSVL